MPYNNPDAPYFQPPPETFEMFADLVGDKNEDEGYTQAKHDNLTADEAMPHTQSSTHMPSQTHSLIPQGRTLPRVERHAPNSQRLLLFDRQPTSRARRENSSHETRNIISRGNSDANSLPQIPTLTAQGRLPPKALRAASLVQRPPGLNSVVPSSTANSPSLDDDEYAFPLPSRGESTLYTRVCTTSRFPEFSAFTSIRDKKKATQVERMRESEEALQNFLNEFPGETKFLAKVPQLEKYKQKLLDGDGLLNSSEAKWVYEVARAVERRRVVIETREFEEKAKAQIRSAGEKRKRKGTTPPSSFSSQEVVTSAHPSTGEKSIPGYVIDGNDENDSDEEQDARQCQKARKTVPGCDGPEISAFDISKALETESETEEYQTENDASEQESEGESDQSGEQSGESSSDDSSDTSEEPEAKAETVRLID